MNQEYITPELEVLYCQPEGVLCGSNELLEENEGEW